MAKKAGKKHKPPTPPGEGLVLSPEQLAKLRAHMPSPEHLAKLQAGIPTPEQLARLRMPAPMPEVPAPPGRRPKRRPGPEPGSVGFADQDRKHFPAIRGLMDNGYRSATAAALELVTAGKVAGDGSAENKARRLAARYRKSLRGAEKT